MNNEQHQSVEADDYKLTPAQAMEKRLMAALDKAVEEAYPTPEEQDAFWKSAETWQDIGDAVTEYSSAIQAYEIGAGSRRNAIEKSTRVLDTVKATLKKRVGR